MHSIGAAAKADRNPARSANRENIIRAADKMKLLKIAQAAAANGRINRTALAVLAFILDRTNNQTGLMTLRARAAATMLGMCERSYRSSTKRLREAGLIHVTPTKQPGGGLQDRNEIRPAFELVATITPLSPPYTETGDAPEARPGPDQSCRTGVPDHADRTGEQLQTRPANFCRPYIPGYVYPGLCNPPILFPTRAHAREDTARSRGPGGEVRDQSRNGASEPSHQDVADRLLRWGFNRKRGPEAEQIIDELLSEGFSLSEIDALFTEFGAPAQTNDVKDKRAQLRKLKDRAIKDQRQREQRRSCAPKVMLFFLFRLADPNSDRSDLERAASAIVEHASEFEPRIREAFVAGDFEAAKALTVEAERFALDRERALNSV